MVMIARCRCLLFAKLYLCFQLVVASRKPSAPTASINKSDESARRNLQRFVSERTELSRNWMLTDLERHQVSYEKHPYEHRRKLQQGNFQPIRITLNTQALQSQRGQESTVNDEKIDLLTNILLPDAVTFWSDALSVIPVSGNLLISQSTLVDRRYCGDVEFSEVPQDHITNGIADTDLVIYVSASNATEFCPAGVWASGLLCNYDQFDRPTAGNINICLDQLDIVGQSKSILLDVLAHEFGHLLGLSSFNFRFFWDPETGMPRTARPFSPKTVTCVDSSVQTLILPDENTLQFFTGGNGERYAAIVTPTVQAVARNQFDCQSLPGARLENLDGPCFGEHWEQHDYYPELMTALIPETGSILSPLTLALLEDSGWYRADYSASQTSPWGLGAGCDFVEAPCLTNTGDTVIVPEYSQGYFCAEEGNRGCSPTLSHKLACTIIDYAFIIPDISPGGSYQYFPSEPTKGGPRLPDYCPLYSSSFGGSSVSSLSCEDVSNADTFNIYSEVYGSGSQCIGTTTGDSRCYRTACDSTEQKLRINIRGEWLLCEFDFQQLDVRVGAGGLPQTIVCPRLSTACPDFFCPKNCEGNGVCNYASNSGGVIMPQCEEFASTTQQPMPVTSSPTLNPSQKPSGNPSQSPTMTTTQNPSMATSQNPTLTTSQNPSTDPSQSPSTDSSESPSVNPSLSPSVNPSQNPSMNPSQSPSTSPSIETSNTPTLSTSAVPSRKPSDLPTTGPTNSLLPSSIPSKPPSNHPSIRPQSSIPSDFPSIAPSITPSITPSKELESSNTPTHKNTVDMITTPSSIPSDSPSVMPSNRQPSFLFGPLPPELQPASEDDDDDPDADDNNQADDNNSSSSSSSSSFRSNMKGMKKYNCFLIGAAILCSYLWYI